jgi:Transcriptional regulators
MIDTRIAEISNFFWEKSISNINQTLSSGQIKNFNMNDYYYLTVIYQLGTPKFGDIADALHLTKPSISAMVQRLIKNELVTKVQSDEDKRIFYVKLTEKGLKIIQGDYDLYRDLANGLMAQLTKQQQADVDCLLGAIADILKKDVQGVTDK